MKLRIAVLSFSLAVSAATVNAVPATQDSSQAETGRITGVVLDSDTRAPIRYANVIVLGTSLGAMTLKNGSFTILDVPSGAVQLRAMMMGYRPTCLNRVVVEAGGTTDLTVVLDKSWPERDAKRRRVVGTEVDVSEIDLQCEITPMESPFRVGDRPRFKVTIRNSSREAIYLVGAIDGSEEKSRYPHVTLTIEGPPGGIEKPNLLGCGNLNALQPGDFTVVQPSGTFEPISKPYWPPTDAIHARFAKAGRYTVTFEYSSEGIDYADWFGRWENGRVDDNLVAMLKKVPRVELRCSISVDVYE